MSKVRPALNASVHAANDNLLNLSRKRPATRLVFLITALACLLVIGSAASFILSARAAQLKDAQVANTNIARMIAVQVELTLKTASFALTDLSERVEIGGTGAVALERLETHLVNVATTSPELHGLFVYGSDGSWLATSLSRPVKGNNSDRDYFRYHQNNADRGVHVGAPVKSRSTNVWVIPVSRRINRPDGSFGGVALVTLRVNFFERIYDELNVGETGTVLVALSDGTLLYRRPFDEQLIGTNISQGPVMQALAMRSSGSSVLIANIDKIERLYSYRRVDRFPVIVAVGRTKDELLSQWQGSSILIAAAVVLICGMFALLAVKLMEQFAIRDRLDQKLRAHSDDLEKNNIGLQVLAHTDKLTGLPNRLMFDEALEREFKRAERNQDCLSLIMLDVDFFKQFNDRYGHVAGDVVLSSVGRVLSEQASRSADVAARYGGEEFAVILPGTDNAGAVGVAERIRKAILALHIAHDASALGQVSASFGVVTMTPASKPGLLMTELVVCADRRLYEAKRRGRNMICNE
jgi:diguanylate cyclase (GGDEF)-like protein